MILTAQKDMVYSRKKSEALKTQKRRINDENRSDQPSKSAISLAANETMIVPTKLRKLQPVVNINDSSCSDSDLIAKNEEEDETGFEVRDVTGGKAYVRKLVSMSDARCILADRGFTSIRQQSDQLLSMQTENANIAASPVTVYRKRNRCRVKAL